MNSKFREPMVTANRGIRKQYFRNSSKFEWIFSLKKNNNDVRNTVKTTKGLKS